MSTLESLITDIARGAVDDVRTELEAKIQAVADAPVPLADPDVQMIQGLIKQVAELTAKLEQFQQAMAAALEQLHAKGGA